MSSSLLLPHVTDAHEAAVRGLPDDVVDSMLDWASEMQATVDEMLAWGRVTFPAAAKPAEPPPSAPAKESKPRAKRTRKPVSSQAILDACPAAPTNYSETPNSSESGNCKALLTSSPVPPPDHSPDVGNMALDNTAALTVTLTLPRSIVEGVAAALGEFHRRRTSRGLPAASPAHTDELDRLAGIWRTLATSDRVAIPVTLPLSDWRGVKGDRMRHPGTMGLLIAAVQVRPGGWPSRLVTEIGLLLWRALN